MLRIISLAVSMCLFAVVIVIVEDGHARCLLSDQPGNYSFIKKRFQLPGEPPVPLRLAYSQSLIEQQVSTLVLKILLEEILHYVGVQLVQTDLMMTDAFSSFQHLTGCSSPTSCNSSSVSPTVMLNSQVWIPPSVVYSDWINSNLLVQAGSISSPARFGWFISQELVETWWNDQGMIIDHWKALQRTSIIQKLFISSSELSNYTSSNITLNMHVPDQCLGTKESSCATLLAGYPDLQSKLAIEQINYSSLNVSVAFLGSKLQLFIQHRNTLNQPVLFLHWNPSFITSNPDMGNFTRIVFPDTSPPLMTTDTWKQEERKFFGFDFESCSLNKFAWSQVRSNAPDVFHLFSKMYFVDFNSLVANHQHGGGNLSSEECACAWLQKSKHIWTEWLPRQTSDKPLIYLAGMFPLKKTGHSIWENPGTLIGAQMAVEHVNNNDSVLANYTLKLIAENTQCRTDLVLNAYIKFINLQKNVTIAGMLGPACSVQAEIVAQVSPFFNTLLMGYSTESVSLADRTKYPLYFRTSPSYSEFKYAYVAVFKKLGWNQYASLSETNYPSSIITSRQEHLSVHGMKLVFSRVIVVVDEKWKLDAERYVRILKESSARIIVADVFGDVARAVICQAYLQGMSPREGYVWFLPFWLSDRWWDTDYYNLHHFTHVTNTELVPCTAREMKNFVNEGYFTLSNAYYANDQEIVLGDQTVAQWKREYERRANDKGVEASGYGSYAYDAVWTYGLALDKLVRQHPYALDTITTNNSTSLLASLIQESNFSGISGDIKFKGADRFLATVNINQHFATNVTTVGKFYPRLKEKGTLELDEKKIIWSSGNRPVDGTEETPVDYCEIESFRAGLGVSCDSAIAIASALGFAVLLIVACLLVWRIMKRRYDKKYKQTQQRMEELGLLKLDPLLQLDEWEVPREKIILTRKLGEGSFGSVFGGESTYLKHVDGCMPIAVKTLKAGSTPEEKLEFLSEAETMKQFDHDSIVRLYGVCTRGEPAYAIMELMIHGDLKNFLLARRQFVHENCREAEDVTPTKLTTFALDIAEGLLYLSSINFVHRDLALRNCMVGSGYKIKIGDFGMTRAMYGSDYYRFGKKGMLPIRWMAPESLCDGVFSSKTDMWSYGVTVWEIASFGSFPYQGLSNSELIEHIQHRHTMDPPEDCTQQLASLLRFCWEWNPERRASPEDVIHILTLHPETVTPCLKNPATTLTAVQESIQDEKCLNQAPKNFVPHGTPSPSQTRGRRIMKPLNNTPEFGTPWSTPPTPKDNLYLTSHLEDNISV